MAEKYLNDASSQLFVEYFLSINYNICRHLVKSGSQCLTKFKKLISCLQT